MIDLSDPLQNDGFLEIKNEGKPEYINAYEHQWLQKPQESLWQGLYNSVKYNAQLGAHSTIESKYISDYLIETQIDDTQSWFQGNDIDDPMIYSEDLKKQYNLDSKYPMTKVEALYKSRMKEASEEIHAKAGKYFDWENQKLNTIAGFAAMMVTAGFSPTSFAAGIAMGAVASPVGSLIGGAATSTAAFAMRWKGMINTFNKAKKAYKLAKTTTRAKAAVLPGVIRAAEITKKALTYSPALVAGVTKAAKQIPYSIPKEGIKHWAIGSATAGAANALEEVVTWHIDNENAYRRDLGEAMKMGIFAPAVLGGMLGIYKGLSKSARLAAIQTKQKIQILDDTVISNKDFNIGFATAKEDLRFKISSALLEGKTSIDELRDIIDTTYKSKPTAELKEELSYIDTVKELYDMVGKDPIDNVLITIKQMLESKGMQADIKKLFPFLRSKEALMDHIKESQDAGVLPKDIKDINSNHVEKIFENKPSDIIRYLEEHAPSNKTESIKRNELEGETKIPEGDRVADEDFALARGADDELEQMLGQQYKEFDSALSTFAKCITGAIDGD